MGVEMVVTAERVILLDAQPVLSETLHDQLCRNPSSVPRDVPPSVYLELMVSVGVCVCVMLVQCV